MANSKKVGGIFSLLLKGYFQTEKKLKEKGREEDEQRDQ
jgi:hypothetical protein